MAALMRAGTATALALLAMFIVPSSASATVAFQAMTVATAAHFTLTQEPASSIVTASLVDDASAYAASTFDSSGGSEAQAASVFPGTLVVEGPSLFCTEVFTCPATPPAYPLLADASYPRNPTATVTDASARASASGNSGQTAASKTSFLAGTPVAISLGASTATSTVTTSASTLTVRAESAVNDVTIAGLIHIASVHALDLLTVRAGHRPVDTPTIVVGGVTVAGQAATIDNTGIHITGHDGPSLTQRLAQHDISIRTIGATTGDTATQARSDATGLEIDFTAPISGTPYVANPLPPPFNQVPGVNANGNYVGHLTLGAVGALAGLDQEPTFSLGSFGSPGATPASTAAATTIAPTSGGAPSSVSSSPGQTAPVVAAPPRSALRGFVDTLSKDALEDLYLVLALGTLAIFVGWRGATVVRHGRSGAGRR